MGVSAFGVLISHINHSNHRRLPFVSGIISVFPPLHLINGPVTNPHNRNGTHRLCLLFLLLLLIISVLNLHLSLGDAPRGHLLQDRQSDHMTPTQAADWLAGKPYLAVSVDQSGDHVLSGAPGGLALPQQVRRWTVGHAGVSRPHLHTVTHQRSKAPA